MFVNLSVLAQKRDNPLCIWHRHCAELWIKGNWLCPTIRNLWVLSAFITGIACRQNKDSGLALCPSYGSLRGQWHSGHLRVYIHTQNEREMKACSSLLWSSTGSGWVVGCPDNRVTTEEHSPNALYCKCDLSGAI